MLKKLKKEGLSKKVVVIMKCQRRQNKNRKYLGEFDRRMANFVLFACFVFCGSSAFQLLRKYWNQNIFR